MRKWYLPMIGLGSLAVLAYSLRQSRGPEWYLGRKDRPTEPAEEFDHEVEGELERIQSALDRVESSLAVGR
ncbi:MAG: hypothetical protein ACRD2Y_03920 [Terriglobales bacterium]